MSAAALPSSTPDVQFAGKIDPFVTHATGEAPVVGGIAYIPCRDYHLDADAVMGTAGQDSLLALHTLYTALGHRKGGTDVDDVPVAAWLGVTPRTVATLRKTLLLGGVLTQERGPARRYIRRTSRPARFVIVPGIAVRALLTGHLTPAEFRVYVYLIHRRGEVGENAGCGRTRGEMAADMRMRTAAVSAALEALRAAGFAARQGRERGTGAVWVPKFAGPVERRRMPACVRYELADRRRRWGIARDGSLRPVDNRPWREVTTPLPDFRQPRSHSSGKQPPGDPQTRRSAQLSPGALVEREGITTSGAAAQLVDTDLTAITAALTAARAAEWDTPGASWLTFRPDDTAPRGPRPASVRCYWEAQTG